MNQTRSGSGAPAAVLAGSLAVFPLLDVLGLLARTRHTGELQVVADGVEARLWVEGGDLLDHAQSAADRLFELACLDDAWFAVSSVLPPGRGEHAERVRLEPLIERVAPHVAEWQALIKALPFGAVARMAPVMPGSEAQIRSEQWRILSLIGTGRPVHEVVDVADGRPLQTLRVINELAQEELIVVELPPADHRRRVHPAGSTARPRRATRSGNPGQGAEAPSGLVPAPEPPAAPEPSGAAEPIAAPERPAESARDATSEGPTSSTPVEPEPAAGAEAAAIAGGEPLAGAEGAPGTTSPDRAPSGDGPTGSGAATGGGGTATAQRRSPPPELPEPGDVVPVGATRAPTTPLTSRRAGTVRTSVAEPAGAPKPTEQEPAESLAEPEPAESLAEPAELAGAEERPVQPVRRASHRVTPALRRPGHHAVAAYMPPPVAPGLWPTPDQAASGPPA